MQPHDRSLTRWRPAAIVWDLDGTLVESAPDLATALNALLNERGCNGHTVARIRPMVGGGVAKLIERGFAAAGVDLDASACDALVPRFMALYSACATRHTHLVPHARDALLHFYNAGLRQAICTNKPLSVTRMILDTLDITGFFGCVVGGDSTPEKKPHPLPLLEAIQGLGARPDEVLMVGDSAADVGAARAAGITVVLVPDGYTGAPAGTLGADHVLRNLADLPRWITPSSPLRRSA